MTQERATAHSITSVCNWRLPPIRIAGGGIRFERKGHNAILIKKHRSLGWLLNGRQFRKHELWVRACAGSILKDYFRWLTRQNVILHNPASELELPRMEKRLPQEVLTLTEVERLLAVPDVNDPLGVRDRAMLE